MTMLGLAFRALLRRPWRTGLTLSGLALAIAVLATVAAFGEGYRARLRAELSRTGAHLMLVPLGCPYDAAARVLQGRSLEHSLPASALEAARRDPAVAVAAPMLLAAVPRPDLGRTDLWVGIDAESLELRPWWEPAAGARFFTGPNSVILGAEAASLELRQVGDALYSPETGRTFRVEGILRRSGTSDDSFFFVPLATAQAMFRQSGRLTAIGVRLKDPVLLPDASERLQRIPGAQVVTLAEMMSVFLNLVGSVRAMVAAILLVTVAASAVAIFETLLSGVLEQLPELAVMRALGASRAQVFGLVALQALLLAGTATLLGLLLALATGGLAIGVLGNWIPLGQSAPLLALDGRTLLLALGTGLGVGLVAGLLPAWHAATVLPARAMRGV